VTSPGPAHRPRSAPGRRVRLVAALTVTGLCGVALVLSAVHGNDTARRYDTRAARAANTLDIAYYDCVDRQVHSVVAPGVPVTLVHNTLPSFVTLLKASGDWLTLPDHARDAVVSLRLVNQRGPGACLDTRVVATRLSGPGRGRVRRGRGASLPGHEPPPYLPL
jgi:hypothetical protein